MGSLIRRSFLLLGVLLAVGSSARASGYYTSPSGSPAGDGSIWNPWTLDTALGQPPPVKPGDTIWMRGGNYSGLAGSPYSFSCRLNGAPGAPITVRQYPGERATIDGAGAVYAALLIQYSSWTIFRDFEVTSSQPHRDTTTAGVWIRDSNNIKLIDMVIHDTPGQGVGFWKENSDSEITGCLIYYNGSTSLHHGIYVHNVGPLPKRVQDNILFDNYGSGIHAYSSAGDSINNLQIEGNVSFDNGRLTPLAQDASPNGANLLVGGETVAASPRIVGNSTYWASFPPGQEWKFDSGQQIGYRAGCTDAIIQNNYFVGGTRWEKCAAGSIISGNTFYSLPSASDNLSPAFSANVYTNARPQGARIFVRPSQYEAGRANIAIYNWEGLPAVGVDVSGFVNVGDSYEVRNAQDFFGPPVSSGTYSGQYVRIPMTGLSIAVPRGLAAPKGAGPEFGAFVLLVLGPSRISPETGRTRSEHRPRTQVVAPKQ